MQKVLSFTSNCLSRYQKFTSHSLATVKVHKKKILNINLKTVFIALGIIEIY